MRIVGGKFKGASLTAPKGAGTRPTSDRVRESLFNILAHGIEEFTLENARVLDLFAGTGALGLEALSRGAAFCLFIEEGSEARGAIRQNIEALQLTGASKVFRRDATKLGEAGTFEAFNLVFADPPYGKGLGEKALLSAQNGGWLTDDAILVLEERADSEIDETVLTETLQKIDERIYGETKVIFYRVT